jgi:class 3 adenylate cyclase
MLQPSKWSRKFPEADEAKFWRFVTSDLPKIVRFICIGGLTCSAGYFLFGAVQQGLAGVSKTAYIVTVILFALFTWGLVLVRSPSFQQIAANYLKIGLAVLFLCALALANFGNTDGRYIGWVVVSGLLFILPLMPATFWQKVLMITTFLLVVSVAHVYAGDQPRHVALYFLTNAAILSAVAFHHDASMRHTFALKEEVENKSAQYETLLRKIYPLPVFERIKHMQNPTFVEAYDEVSVMFIDIVGFTSIAMSKPPREVVNMLNELFSRIDASCKTCGAVKIKTIGDAYLAVTGMDGSPDHASTMADLALEVREAVHKYSFLTKNQFDIRIGIHTGKVVGGIIGRETSHFDIWGETVNLASRLESHGTPGKIQVSEAFACMVQDRYATSQRGVVNLKGFGELSCMLLDGPKTPVKELSNQLKSA